MFRNLIFAGFVILIFILPGCNTLNNIKTINIEIAVPAKVIMPADYRTAAIRYNNCNVAINPFFSKYYSNNKVLSDSTNLDIIASKIYFQSFTENMENQFFLDSLIILEPFDYSDFIITDSLKVADFLKNDSLILANTPRSKFASPGLARLINLFPPDVSEPKKQKIIDPEFGLYSNKELQQIADTTGVELLFSLDYFGAIDYFSDKLFQIDNSVYLFTYWNIYDIKKKEILFFIEKVDTVTWSMLKDDPSLGFKKVPPREEAVFSAADEVGWEFANYLFPHWTEVQRMYYKSGNVELKETEKLIEQGEWLKAAEIWKANIANKNKNIAAKSMFNLALANEMEGNIDGAIDWAVKSFFLLGQKNEIHHKNCLEYINLLGQRKLDLKNINAQLNVGISNIPENKNE